LRRTANVEVARDITAETFSKAFRNLSRFRWKNISISSWLYRIASNEIISFFRHNKYEPESLDELREVAGFEHADSRNVLQEIQLAEQELERHKDFLQIQRLLGKLPTKYQEVIALRYFEGKKIKDIAAILGKNEGTVKSLISRGLEQLRILSQEKDQL
jgi:RNA polymerase sigma-70 factor (ECF subfamily)